MACWPFFFHEALRLPWRWPCFVAGLLAVFCCMAGAYPAHSARTAPKIKSFLTAKRKYSPQKENRGKNALAPFIAWPQKMVRTSSHVWMPLGQNFVVLLSITEVQ